MDYEKRKKFIIRYIEAGISQREIAHGLGLSSERVRLIYKKATGKSTGHRKADKTKIKYRRKFYCNWCGVMFYPEGNRIFCKKCGKGKENWKIKARFWQKGKARICFICKSLYLPFRNETAPSIIKKRLENHQFCSTKCNAVFQGYKRSLRRNFGV